VFNELFPHRVDHTYRGYKPAVWLFALVVSVKIAQSLSAIFYGYATAIAADGIPLDTFPPEAGRAMLSIFARLGLRHLMLCLFGIVALVQYRALIPLMFALFLLELIGARLILRFIPIGTGTPIGSDVNLALIAVAVAGFALSLRSERRSAT
jgi:hypothetical protein